VQVDCGGEETERAAETKSNIAIALAQLGKMEESTAAFEQVIF
jgi:hypothetical protein